MTRSLMSINNLLLHCGDTQELWTHALLCQLLKLLKLVLRSKPLHCCKDCKLQLETDLLVRCCDANLARGLILTAGTEDNEPLTTTPLSAEALRYHER